ncbi:hypothetical protein SteCoe_13081 [Stentor coeruleus]|uniref:Uncharacterized protein n=1 Tax=Stentor coeruleus TaxID=5963 RepID=A0A1R2C9E0_9CILI|nr:hypothetical protein SteCoe_13081 [Stentor coeruleus]
MSMRKSEEIQTEVNKLYEISKDVSQHPRGSKEHLRKAKEEKNYWKDLNAILSKHGFSTILGKNPTANAIADILIDVLTDYASLKTNFRELEDQLAMQNLAEKAFNSTPPNKSKKISIYETEDSTPNPSVSYKLSILEETKILINSKSYEDIIPDLTKIKKVMMSLPSIEKFINSICKELVPNTNTPDYMDQAMSKFKSLCKIQKEFNFIIEENMNMKKILDYFCKLFDVHGTENVMESIECVFYFVHEMKEFLEVVCI